MIGEWRWNEHRAGADGVTLYADRLAWWSANWATPFAEVGPLRVRMGLHTGEVERQGDHYFGTALYRGARLTNAAHGGQVLLSSATVELVREALPVAVGLRDLGEHRPPMESASRGVTPHPPAPAPTAGW
jgi:class 3 adenylate cyclase